MSGPGIEGPDIERAFTGHWSWKGRMMHKRVLGLVALIALVAMSGCAPLLIGGGAAVVADEAIEQDQGGDGLF